DISVFTFNGQWEKDIKSVCKELDKYRFKKDFKRRIYKSIVGEFPIYISDPKVDGISRRIDYNGTFEPRIFQTIYDFVNHDSDINVIDIGANVGAISLQVAKWGRHVLSIEASDMNVRRYCAGAKDANIGKYTTLVHNAISDNHEPVRFILGRRGESGGNFIDESDIRKAKKRIDGNIYDYKHSVELKTVMLDDVLSLPNACLFQKVFIKVDVEGAEHKVFQGARKFFEKNDVIGVLMEWSWHRLRNGTKDIIINFMKEFKFDSFAYNERNLTSVDAQYTDEHDLLWLPRKRKD
ncbi:hypothetical protein FSP39_014320, partial [Pinctada imbricata]